MTSCTLKLKLNLNLKRAAQRAKEGRTASTSAKQPPLPNGERTGYQYAPPFEGKSLVGWRVQLTYESGPENEMRWHEGYIFEYESSSGPTGSMLWTYTHVHVSLSWMYVYMPRQPAHNTYVHYTYVHHQVQQVPCFGSTMLSSRLTTGVSG